MDFSIVIPTFNRARFLRAGLTLLLKQNFLGEQEIIIVDDGSTDDTRIMVLKEFNLSQIRYIYLPKDGVYTSQSRPVNAGLKAAQYEYTILMDPEILVPQGMVETHLKIQEENHGCFISTVPMMVDKEYTESLLENPEQINGSKHLKGTVDGRPDFFDNQFASFKTEEARAIGGYDERFTCWGYNGIDFAKRLAERQKHITITGVYHIWHDSCAIQGNQKQALRQYRQILRERVKHV